MYLTQPLHQHVQQSPDELATIDGDRTRNWREFRDAVARFAGALHGFGLQCGDRVAILSRNSDHFLDFLYGTLWAGGVINPVNLRWTAEEIAYSLENCATAILIVSAEFEELLPELRARAAGLQHILVIGSPEYVAWLGGAVPAADARRRGDDLAAILYTGGTTGFPKGVMLSHRNLMVSAVGTIASQAGRVTERYLHNAPLFHIGALGGLFMAMASGSTNILIPAFEPVALLDAVERHEATELFMVPTMMRMLIDHPRFAEFDLSTLRRIRYGASAIDDALMDRLLATLPDVGFIQAYGMTELAPVATILAPVDHVAGGSRLRSAGRATPVTEVRVVGPDDRELPCGEIGEIVCRGDNVMLGYWEMPEATAEALRGGWMHTGDLGTMDADGFVTVVDRLKDMIITGGENVYSVEVESVLASHPDVAAAVAIGIPDIRWGEAVHAVLILRPGAIADVASIEAHARASLAGFKRPKSYSIVDDLPLSAAGKVLKNALRDRFKASADGARGVGDA